MKNTTELRQVLSEVVADLRNGKLDAHEAEAIVGASNAILKSAQLDLKRAELFARTSPIGEFLKPSE